MKAGAIGEDIFLAFMADLEPGVCEDPPLARCLDGLADDEGVSEPSELSAVSLWIVTLFPLPVDLVLTGIPFPFTNASEALRRPLAFVAFKLPPFVRWRPLSILR